MRLLVSARYKFYSDMVVGAHSKVHEPQSSPSLMSPLPFDEFAQARFTQFIEVGACRLLPSGFNVTPLFFIHDVLRAQRERAQSMKPALIRTATGMFGQVLKQFDDATHGSLVLRQGPSSVFQKVFAPRHQHFTLTFFDLTSESQGRAHGKHARGER